MDRVDRLQADRVRIGVISDTHGMLRPQAMDAIADCDLVLHAGDIGDLGVIDGLEHVARVHAVRGNVDLDGWALRFPQRVLVDVGDRWLYVVHNLDDLDLEPRAAGICAVIFGHSHRPTSEVRDGVLFFNPGSAGPRRFSSPVSVGRLDVGPDGISGELIDLRV